MDLQYWFGRPMSKMHGWFQEVGLLLLLLLLFLWQLSDRPVLAWCTCIAFLGLITKAVVRDLRRHEADSHPVASNGQVPNTIITADLDDTSQDIDLGDPRFMSINMATGQRSTSNSPIPTSFDSEVAHGHLVCFHRPSEDNPGDPDGQYFKGKKRNWELRFQCTFKVAVRASDMRIGAAAFERAKIGAMQASLQRAVLKLAGPTLGNSLYNSPGDDPETCEGECEHPVTSVSMCECDQYIAYSRGEELPNLWDHGTFSKSGSLKVHDARAYRKAMSAVTFQPGEVHTFAFWAPSRFFNLIDWRLVGIPFLGRPSLEVINGPPPVLLSLYTLTPEDGAGETRHVDSRRSVIIKTACWSSLFPPSSEWMEKIQASSPTSRSAVATRPIAGRLDLAQTRKARLELGRSPDAGCCGSGVYQLFREGVASITEGGSRGQRSSSHSKSE